MGSWCRPLRRGRMQNGGHQEVPSRVTVLPTIARSTPAALGAGWKVAVNESGQGTLEQHDAEPTVVDNISEVTTPYLGETRVSVVAAQPHVRFDTIEPPVLRVLLRGPSMGQTSKRSPNEVPENSRSMTNPCTLPAGSFESGQTTGSDQINRRAPTILDCARSRATKNSPYLQPFTTPRPPGPNPGVSTS